MTENNDEQIIISKWDEIRQNLQQEFAISGISYRTWIEPLTVYSVKDQIVTIQIHSDQSQMLRYISERYTKFFEVIISETMGQDYAVTFILEKEEKHDKPEDADGEVAAQETRSAAEASNLNPRYTFDTFVVGKTNQFAHSACVAVAESPGEAYNPLFIYGGAGLGKTHLMHSIGHYVLAHDPGKKVLYVTSEQFTNEVIECIRSKTASSMSRLRDKYRKVDVLLIDDIQFIIGKDATQEEFFHTFNELHSAGKQIVLSSDRPPREMETLDERFRSRFEWGLIADIQPPDYETRMAILRSYAENSMRKVDGSILEYIAANIKSNIRELEGAYNKIIAYSRLNNVDINLENAREALKDIIYPDTNATATPEMILGTVCDHFGVRPGDITGRKRSSEFVVPRQVCMYILREYTGLTLDRIGKELGGKDHTTVMHGADKIKEDLRTNDELKSNVDSILKKLNLIN